jgi:hypothetical protein
MLTLIDTILLTKLSDQVNSANSTLLSSVTELADLQNQLSILQNKLNTANQQSLFPLNYAKTSLNLEMLTTWIQAGNLGNSAGNTATGTFVMTPAPLGTGKPANFSAKGNAPYADSYWYVGLGAQPNATKFRQALSFMLPTPADLTACQAVEFEIQQDATGEIWNMAWQCDFTSKKWRYFDYTAKKWVASYIPVNVTAGKWVDVVAEYVRTGTQMCHVGITIDGVWYPVLASFTGWPSGGEYLNAAFQLDCNGMNPPPSFNCQVKNYDVSWS